MNCSTTMDDREILASYDLPAPRWSQWAAVKQVSSGAGLSPDTHEGIQPNVPRRPGIQSPARRSVDYWLSENPKVANGSGDVAG
jgi:hypothetical protein